MLLTKRETRLVLPTPKPPSMQSLCWSMAGGLSPKVRGADIERHAAVPLLVGFIRGRVRGGSAADAGGAERDPLEPLRLHHLEHASGTTLAQRQVGLGCTVGVGFADELHEKTPSGGAAEHVERGQPGGLI